MSQLRRAASSIPTNLAEGFKRRGIKDFAHFVNISEGSLEETKYILFLSCELNYFKKDEYNKFELMCDEVGKMLGGLYKKLNS